MSSEIHSQIEKWRKHLLDTSKRNRLVNFKYGRTGGVELVRPDAADLWHQLVTEERQLEFPWKRELIDLPPEAIDAEKDAVADGEPAGDEPPAPAEVMRLCLSSQRLRDDHLVTPLTDKHLSTRLNRLALNAKEALTEQGVSTLFAAFGFLKWYESDDSQEEVLSPLLLVPVGLERQTVESPGSFARARTKSGGTTPSPS